MNKNDKINSNTTLSEDFDDIIIGLMFNLLKSSHPVKRFKDKKHFKRGVDINGKMFLLPRDNYSIFSLLYSELDDLYAADSEEIIHVLTTFYSIKS